MTISEIPLSHHAIFWAKIQKTDGCWLWPDLICENGYGRFWTAGKTYTLAHRASYMIAVGPIPEGMQIDHMCHVRHCVNPAHLRAVTPKQNMENRKGAHRNSKSGVRGVSWRAARGKWEVNVKHNRVKHYGGMYADIDQANAVAVAMRNEMHTHNDLDRAA